MGAFESGYPVRKFLLIKFHGYRGSPRAVENARDLSITAQPAGLSFVFHVPRLNLNL
jgi:poly(3-hydroxybutyrate) depolymerase